ncbi:MAG TPA: 3-deoxy-D-manno-octulosonic acid transferase, partial [Pseudomonadota bacterium]|nr:3-deoxy-D-manno-octulosonic acid transferase [Pseudomonadota bacterium]
TGPHTFNFAEITDSLIAGAAALRVADGVALGDAVVRLLGDAALREAMGAAARHRVESERGAVARIVEIAAQHLH